MRSNTQRISLVVIGCVLSTLLSAAAFAQTPNPNCPSGSGEICSVPSSVVFANTYIGKASGNKTLTIYNNTTSGTIFIETIGFSCTTGSGSDFGIASGTVPFQMGTTQTLTHYSIFFQPRSAVAYNCDFVLTMLDGFVLDVPLTGTGLSSSSVSSLSKTAMTFSNQGIGTTSAAQTVTITNTGTSTMNLEAINISPPSFTTNTVTFPFAIKANASLTLSVYYTPSQVTSETGVLDLDYDAVPDNGVTLNGTGIADTTLAISSSPTLPQATQGYAYEANLLTSGGTGPYTWSLASGSSLPPGLSISPAGSITGTVSSSASTSAPYTFTVQVSDNTTGKTANSLMNIAVWPYLGDGNGESCNDLSWNDPVLGTPLLALTDLGTGFYQNSAYEGGLYPNGSNVRPSSQDSYGVSLANQIQPLDANGNPSPTGKYVLMAVGESTAQNEFNRFLPMANADPAKNPNLVIVNGAQGGATPNLLTTTTSTYWTTVLENYLPQNGVTQNQVAAIWLEDTDGIASGTFPTDITDLQSQYESMMQTMLTLFPNLKLVYFSSRVYAGYSNGLATPDNPEPYAYEVGFAVKWAIQDQINGNSNLCDGNGCSPVVAPWMSWGAYYWSNGMLGRSDGLVWDCEDFSSDGTHPSSTFGQLKVATKLLQFLKTDDTAVPWYLASTLTLMPTSGSGQSGNVGTTLPNPLTVTAENTNTGAPQSGVTVTFTDNGAKGTFNPSSGTTNSSGQISTSYTLPSTAQTINVTATATGYAAANFTETATASTQTLTATAGNNQTGTGGVALPVALQVTATSGGNPASGVTVTFVDNAGGTFNPASGTTGSNGTLSTVYTPPTVTQTTSITVTASATGYNSATFSETATAPVQALNVTSGNNQSGSTGTALPLPLVVTATSNGNNASGVTVSFVDNGAGGSFNPASGVSGSNGQVSTVYTCGSTAATVTITASATGYTSATFTETCTGTNTDVLSIVGGNNQSGPVGTKLAKSLEVKATINGSPASGVTITFNDGGAQGVFGNPVGTTGTAGTIFTTYTLPSTPQTVTITATAAGFTSAVFTETATASEVLTATSGGGQTGAVGVALPTPLVVTATNNGTAQSGVTVSFSDGQGGTFNPASGTTGSNGQISTVYTPEKSGTLTVTASATGYTSATFSETATAAVQTLTATSGNNQSGSGQLPLPLVVTATSNGTNQSGVTVSFTDNGAGGSFNPASGVSGSNGQVSTNY
ncbi:MAG: choice-of-anchor D domain-containing protein, partial [Candidatus Sulfotelmatobacter sp.]